MAVLQATAPALNSSPSLSYANNRKTGSLKKHTATCNFRVNRTVANNHLCLYSQNPRESKPGFPSVRSLSSSSPSLDVRCFAQAQSQGTATIQKEKMDVNKAPINAKEKTPQLDDGGTGGGPGRGDGGGGGGGKWFGFFFMAFCTFLGLMKEDKDGNGSNSRRKAQYG